MDDVLARVRMRERMWTVSELSKALCWSPKSTQGQLRRLAARSLAARLHDGRWVATDSTAEPAPGSALSRRLLQLLRAPRETEVSQAAVPAVTAEPAAVVAEVVAAAPTAAAPVRELLKVLVPARPTAAARVEDEEPEPRAAAVVWPVGGVAL